MPRGIHVVPSFQHSLSMKDDKILSLKYKIIFCNQSSNNGIFYSAHPNVISHSVEPNDTIYVLQLLIKITYEITINS